MSMQCNSLESLDLTARMDDGGEIAIRRWSPARAERVVISHGNGLAIDAFREFGEELATRYEVIAFDMRNHGRSPLGRLDIKNWERLIADIPEIFDQIEAHFGKKPTHGAFHSLSSVTTLIAQSQTPRPWKSLTLFEPPVPPVADKHLLAEFVSTHDELIGISARRRQKFREPEQLLASFRRAPAFEGLSDTTLRRLAKASLRFNCTGGETPWELACPAEFESETFETKPLQRYWDDLRKVAVPVLVAVGDEVVHDMPSLIRSSDFLARTFGFHRIQLPGVNHLMQLQKPGLCARAAIDFALQHAGQQPRAGRSARN